MSRISVRVALPYQGDCGHAFKISAVGVTPETEITCPVCGASDHLDASFIDEIEQQWADAIEACNDDEVIELLWAALDADPVDRATIIED